jgi:DNA polymerase-3 subunit gamma/tau
MSRLIDPTSNNMSYQVLARRWRPQRFDEIVGQLHVTQTLKNALKQGRLAHAFLFTGPRGVGKTSTARILARAVNCVRVDREDWPEPCNECETCKALLEDREMDVIEMDAASYRGIDDVRRINEVSRMSPVAGTRKVYIIDEVHMFTKEAFNAFLKTLEEPPRHVIFVLATTDVQKVPSTILSRVQRFDFRPVQPQDIVPYLQKICEDPMRDGSERWNAEPEALWVIARRAEGSLRDAEGLLDQVVSFGGNTITYEETRRILGVLPNDLLANTTRILAEHQLSEVPTYFEDLIHQGHDYVELLRALQTYWMDLIFLKQGLPLNDVPEEEVERMKSISDPLGVEDIFRLIRLAESLEDSLKWSTAPRVRFEVSFLRWVTLDRTVTIQEVIGSLGSDGGGIPIARHASSKSATQNEHAGSPAPPPAPAKKTISTSQTAASPSIPPSHAPSLDDLKALWPDIVRLIAGRNPAAGAQAQSHWELVSFDGRKLGMRCNKSGAFHEEQMKENFSHLSQAVLELTGTQVIPVISPSPAASVRPAAGAKPVVSKLPPKPAVSVGADKDDLFKNLMSRVDGVEIDPKSLRRPK